VLDAVVSGNEEGSRHAEEQAVRNDSRVASNPRQCEGELMMAEAQRECSCDNALSAPTLVFLETFESFMQRQNRRQQADVREGLGEVAQ
jgi:hypothetical protein